MALSDYSDLFNSAGQANGIDPDLLRSVASVESSGDPNAVSPQGAVGLMQLMPSTAKALGVTDATDPKQAIPAAAKLIAANARQFGSPDAAILAYHGGTDQANWGPKTQAYLGKVTNAYQQLKSGTQVSQAAQPQSANDAFTAAFSPTSAGASAPVSGLDAFDAAFSAPTSANQPPAGPPPSILEGLARGVVRGAKSAIGSVVPVDAWIANKLGYPDAANRLQSNLKTFQQQGPAFNRQYGIPGQIGQVVGQVATTLPAMAYGGEALGAAGAAARAVPYVGEAANAIGSAIQGNKLLSLAAKGVVGAGQGATAAALTSGQSDQPIGQQMTQGAELGGALGTALPAVAGAGGAIYNKLTGGGVNPATAALADKAINQYKIPLRGSQISSSPFIHMLDSNVGKLPFSGMEADNEIQKTAFTKAVAGTMGSTASDLSPSTMSSIRSNLSGNYNQVAARTAIPVVGPAGDPMRTAFGNTMSEASRVLSDPELKPLQNQVAHILSSADPTTGAIPGDVYKALTADGGSLDRLTQSKDPNVRFYASQIEKSLNDALTANAAPEDAALLKQTNPQWKNMRTVQDLASKAGIEGEISPTALLGAVRKSYKNMAYTGAGPIGDLAQIGQRFLKETPSSTTAERATILGGLGLGGDAIANLGHDPNALLHSAAMMGGTLGLGRLTASALKSTAYRNALLRSVTQGQSSFAPTFGIRSGIQTLGTQTGHYAVPLGVIAAQQNQLSAPPVASTP